MTQVVRVEWTVEGIDCSACKAKIERVVADAKGVERAEVVFMTQKLTVEFDPSLTSRAALEKRVVGLG